MPQLPVHWYTKPRGAGDARRRNIHTHMNASSTPTHTTYGIPILLEDRTGHLAGSDFVDIHDRLRLRLRCTARAPTHTAYEICRLPTATSAFASSAVIGLTFGPCDALGIITVGGWPAVPMDEYLGKVAPSGSSRCRVFVASDGRKYRWTWRGTAGQEWTVSVDRSRARSAPEGRCSVQMTTSTLWQHILSSWPTSPIMLARQGACLPSTKGTRTSHRVSLFFTFPCMGG